MCRDFHMRRFVLGWKKLGLEERLGSRIVTYADDLVILCTRGNADEALIRMRELMRRLKLTVNEEKTRICTVRGTHARRVRHGPGAMPRRCRRNTGLNPARRRGMWCLAEML